MGEHRVRSALYDTMCGIADRLFGYCKPCDIRKRNDITICNGKYTCCSPNPRAEANCVESNLDCQYLNCDSGCTVKGLACKLYLCEEVAANNIMMYMALKSMLVAARAFNLIHFRSSKEDVWGRLRLLDKRKILGWRVL